MDNFLLPTYYTAVITLKIQRFSHLHSGDLEDLHFKRKIIPPLLPLPFLSVSPFSRECVCGQKEDEVGGELFN